MARQSFKNVMRLINTNKELPVEQSFLADLKRSIEITADGEKRKPSQTYKPSSMNCIRNMYYQIVGADADEGGPTSNYIMVGIVNSGSDIHVRVQTAVDNMKNNGMDCVYVDVADFVRSRNLTDIEVVSKQGVETKLFHKKYNMSFLCDGIIKYKGKYYILELKTETASKFFHRDGVDPSHYNQATAYSIAFGLDNVIFIYISRDTLDMKAFMFNVSGLAREVLLAKIKACDEYVKNNTIPPLPEDVIKKTCDYCQYRKRCAKDA